MAHFTGIEIKIACSLESWSAVSSYFLGGDIQRRELVTHVDVRENGLADKFSLSEQFHQALESESIVDNSSMQESYGALLLTVNTVQEHVPPVGEPQKHTYASILLKLRVTKGQAVPSVAPEVSLNKNSTPASDWDHTTRFPFISSNVVEMYGADIIFLVQYLKTFAYLETIEQPMFAIVSTFEADRVRLFCCPCVLGEIKSVYVRNLPSTVSESEIEEEFKKFGEISPDGVMIRSRMNSYHDFLLLMLKCSMRVQDVGVCYAFVEFEDMVSIRNAVKV
ncbi:hypothetical protein GQ457_09G022310 [Hibiscus cannabinus]